MVSFENLNYLKGINDIHAWIEKMTLCVDIYLLFSLNFLSYPQDYSFMQAFASVCLFFEFGVRNTLFYHFLDDFL